MAAVCRAFDAAVQYGLRASARWIEGGAGVLVTGAQFDDWPIVLAVDLACTGMNRKSMAARGGVVLHLVLKGQRATGRTQSPGFDKQPRRGFFCRDLLLPYRLLTFPLLPR